MQAPKRLLPAPDKTRNVGEASCTGKRKKPNRACHNCRSKKIGCNRQRPVCFQCSRHSLACFYDFEDSKITPNALKRDIDSLDIRVKEHPGLLEYLYKVPESEAIKIVRYLQSSKSIAAVLFIIKESTPRGGEWPVMHDALSLKPHLKSRLEMELAIQHPNAYPTLEPPKIVNTMPDNASQSFDIKPVSRKIQQPSKLCDPRLSELDMKCWTQVSINNELAANVISHYLEMDHPFHGFFDAELVLSGLINQEFTYCSPFLVSSWMSLACQSCTSIGPEMTNLSYSFFNEAEDLRPAECLEDSPVTLAALNLLSVAAGRLGKWNLGQHVLVSKCREMATRMKLLDTPPTSELELDFHLLEEMEVRLLAHVAWGTYGRQSFYAGFFPQEPIMYPPVLPIPGDSSQTLYGKTQWPELVQSLPKYMGCTFPAVCRLWVIVQEVFAVYNLRRGLPIVNRVPPGFAEQQYQKLLVLVDRLPNELIITEHSASHVYLFHGILHTTVLNIFRPFLHLSNRLRLWSIPSPDNTSLAVFSASLTQLKHLIFRYQTFFPRHFRSPDFYAVVLHLSSVVIKQASSDQSSKFYFLVCFSFWSDMVTQYQCFKSFVPGHLCLALEEGAVTKKEARALLKEFESHETQYQESVEEGPLAVMDFERGIEGHGEGMMPSLSKKFQQMVNVSVA